MKFSATATQHTCNGCGKTQPIDQFRVATKREKGVVYKHFTNICSECYSARRKETYRLFKKDNPDFKKKNREKTKAYVAKNRELINQRQVERRKKNIDAVREKERNHYAKNRDKILESMKPYASMRQKKIAKELTDGYVIHNLKTTMPEGTTITSQMVEFKRIEILTFRIQKEISKKKKLLPRKPRAIRGVSAKNTSSHKICNTCGKDQPIQNFCAYKTRTGKTSRVTQCHQCKYKYKRQWKTRKQRSR